ncbi:MAG: hypothetical protein FJX62_00365 [Alphaproteobacteria bacterium]|nr:hypothetical protein [Alphaproteobacteria bacterium]
MAASTASTVDAAPDAANCDDEAAMVRALMERMDSAGRSTAELLHVLRQAFPESPLSVRVAALKAIGTR